MKNIIDSIVGAVTARVLAELGIGPSGSAQTPTTTQTQPAQMVDTGAETLETILNGHSEPEPAQTTEPVERKRRKRNFKPRVAYRLTAAGKRIAADKGKSAKLREVLFPTTLQTFRAIVQASPETIHAGRLKAETGLKMKTIESDVYKLRTTTPALIESVKLDDTK